MLDFASVRAVLLKLRSCVSEGRGVVGRRGGIVVRGRRAPIESRDGVNGVWIVSRVSRGSFWKAR
jgi:hypothetical protein